MNKVTMNKIGFEKIKQTAEQGDEKSQMMLCTLYIKGIDIEHADGSTVTFEQNLTKAENIARKIAEITKLANTRSLEELFQEKCKLAKLPYKIPDIKDRHAYKVYWFARKAFFDNTSVVNIEYAGVCSEGITIKAPLTDEEIKSIREEAQERLKTINAIT